jgi:hypothetical protein
MNDHQRQRKEEEKRVELGQHHFVFCNTQRISIQPQARSLDLFIVMADNGLEKHNKQPFLAAFQCMEIKRHRTESASPVELQ